MKLCIHLIVFGSITLTQSAFSEETKLELENVPEAVIKTAKMEVPGIHLLEADMENEDGVVIYELEGEKDDYEYEFEISENGKLLELQKEKKDK